jgi:cell division protein FtsB
VVALALLFAVAGGEYSTWNWWQLRRQEREERAAVSQLARSVDSLERTLKAIQTDPATQERLAREQFGMIRRGEFLYRLVPGDSSER